MALQQFPEISSVCLGEVSEFAENFVLDCGKGKEMDSSIPRGPCRHGAKAEKRGISKEYVCICTGIQRNSSAIASTVNRAEPRAKELLEIFEGYIADGIRALCDGLCSYRAFPGIADCIVKDCNGPDVEDTCFYNLNTVNGVPVSLSNGTCSTVVWQESISTDTMLSFQRPIEMRRVLSNG